MIEPFEICPTSTYPANIEALQYPNDDSTCSRTTDDGETQLYGTQRLGEYQENFKREINTQFNSILSPADGAGSIDADKLKCLLNYILTNIEKNNDNYNEYKTELDTINARIAAYTQGENGVLERQKTVIDNHKDSELVTKFRNESSEGRNNAVTTKFTIYVTFIILLLLVEAIVFFV